MQSVAGSVFISFSPAASLPRTTFAGRTFCTPCTNDHCGFSQPLAGAGKSLPETLFNHDIFKCQAHSNKGNISGITFQDYSQEENDLNFFERLVHAWRILFPPKAKHVSNAEIAKQRLKMILISDRCAISDEAKRKIVDNVVGALSNFVEIESEEKVQLNVSADPDLGTVYSVIVPVRRVKPEYQDYGMIGNIDYGEEIGNMRTLDIRFEYPELKDGQ